MPKQIWLLILAMAINVTAASFLWPLNMIYMHYELGTTLAFAGVILFLNQGAAIIGNLVGGTLFDKLGGYRTILLGGAVTIVSAITLSIFHSLIPYAILLICIGFGTGVVVPAMYALAASVWPEGGRRPFNAIYVAQNIGVAVGTATGGLVASYSFSYAFLSNAILFSAFYFLVFFTFKPLGKKTDTSKYSTVASQGFKIHNRKSFVALIILSIGFFIAWVAYVQWQSTIATYTIDLGIPIDQYTWIWVINGLLIISGQPLIKLVTKYITSPKVQILLGNTIFIISFSYLLQAGTFLDFATGMVILTLGEMLVWPAVPTIAASLAPKGREGFYQGMINSVGTGGRMVGPLFGGLIADHFPMVTLFGLLIILLLVPYVSIFVLGKLQKRIEEEQKHYDEELKEASGN
ncbi:MDR family MFS transporter [Alkalibacillus haloalkaliphilus]|uniref:MDR family MFS transporter n=1 Tax=Alkalibacillus haloalkaliphilus TaxID=94136 RepID=UPI0002F3AFAB|nr:MFS transporter [Alkalibacillus haloalkaliphilus]